eukprot:4739367-Prymnesium_polylepis.1
MASFPSSRASGRCSSRPNVGPWIVSSAARTFLIDLLRHHDRGERLTCAPQPHDPLQHWLPRGYKSGQFGTR